ncbi:MAG: hypothetical protein U0Q22_00185 [Acidimicrobiales bacterium]
MVGRGVRVVGSLAVGAALAVGLSLALSDSSHGDDAAERASARTELLRRWEEWRRAPLRFSESVDRRSGEQHLSQRVTVAQRFPDRVVRDGSSVSARVGGRSIGCGPDAQRQPVCVDNGPYDATADLAAELSQLRRLTSGATPTYSVSSIGRSCFRLRHLVTELRPPWGDRTDYCFAAGGALTRETEVVGALTITTRRTGIGAPVDQDFALPAPPAPRVNANTGAGSASAPGSASR